MSVNKNSEYKIARLSDGRDIKIDVEALRRDVKTRRDIKAIINLPPGSDDYDAFLAKYSDMATEDVIDLSIADFQAIDGAVSKALQELSRPNSK